MRSLLAALLCLASAGPASAAVINVAGDGRFISFGKLRADDGLRLGRALDVFGRPDERNPVGDGAQACHLEWFDRALHVTSANFGNAPEGHTTCERKYGYIQVLRVRGKAARPLWRTNRGLRTGDSKARMRTLYPDAFPVGGGEWSLLTRSPGIGEGPTPILMARVRLGKVSSISVWAGGAGD